MTPQSERDILAAGAGEIGVSLAAVQVEALLLLIDELERANAQFNLTAIRDREGMLRKHLLDSLSLHPYLHGRRVADVGTGAGFPGIPLAVANSERRFVLIEATGKKARFAAAAAKRIGCSNVEVVHARAEDYRPRELFDTVTARALSLTAFVAHASHLCAPGGRLLAMKGRHPNEEISALPQSHRVLAVHRVEVPGLNAARHVVELSAPALESSHR